MTTIREPWIPSFRPNPQARLRLFCFPYAGGGASAFHGWSNALPRGIQVCPVQLPGHENRLREPYFTRLMPLVQAVAQALTPYLDMPFAFFGHSLGALVSFELARQLGAERKLEPACLFVSGHAAPQIPDLHPPVHQLPDAGFLEQLRNFNGTPREVLQNSELMQILLPILRADFAMNETYVYPPGKALRCPISAFGGLQDPLANREELTAWREQTCGPFKLRIFLGGHFFLHSARMLVLRAIAEDLTFMS